jgi:hypothetical protein
MTAEFVVSKFQCACGIGIEVHCLATKSGSGFVGHYQVACPKCKRKAETPTPPLRLLYEDGDHWSTIILESKNEEWSKTIADKVFTYRSERRTDGGTRGGLTGMDVANGRSGEIPCSICSCLDFRMGVDFRR